ncbi:MAG: T9SS type A sorting domain-containing protein [Flavobacteriales bacterium]|nr:T9SS type A sorting domain-containing protein [Flavobacteriales bacterium]
MLYPNPVDQTCFLYGLIPGEQAWVFDLEGRMVLSTKIAADGTGLDVSSLAPGTYVVNAEGLRPQRLIIAR